MDAQKRKLKGSKTRDQFKYLHKNLLNRSFYALDSDLELVEKHPPFIVARLDFKCLGDSISFTEGIAYNEYTEKLAPIYIIEAQCRAREFIEMDSETHRFNVYQYIQADWHPNPVEVEQELLHENLTWDELGEWEGKLRQYWRKQRKESP